MCLSERQGWVSHVMYPLTCRNSECRGSLYHNNQSDRHEHRNILGQSFRLILSHARDTDPNAQHRQQAQLIKRTKYMTPTNPVA